MIYIIYNTRTYVHDGALSFNPLNMKYLNKTQQFYSKLIVPSPDICNYVVYNCIEKHNNY